MRRLINARQTLATTHGARWSRPVPGADVEPMAVSPAGANRSVRPPGPTPAGRESIRGTAASCRVRAHTPVQDADRSPPGGAMRIVPAERGRSKATATLGTQAPALDAHANPHRVLDLAPATLQVRGRDGKAPRHGRARRRPRQLRLHSLGADVGSSTAACFGGAIPLSTARPDRCTSGGPRPSERTG